MKRRKTSINTSSSTSSSPSATVAATAATLMAISVLLIISTISPVVEAQFLDHQEADHHSRRNSQGRLIVVDKTGKTAINLSPGLLEESLIKRGSFDFNPKLVKFDKLKVLGNIYVHRINGHYLREHYLLKSNSMPGAMAPPQSHNTSS